MKRHVWTDDQVEILRCEYANTPTRDLAARFCLPMNRVYAKASKLGLAKSEEYFRTHVAGRLTEGSDRGAATRFPVGIRPWNKGKAHPHRNDGQFKPGRRPQTWVPVGTMRVTKDGILQRKVSDVSGPGNLRWRSVHETVWIDAHGAIPAGHVVVFRPGQKTSNPAEITVDRLELISRADLVRRNSIHRHGPEIAHLSQLKGAITRQINKRTRGAE